MASSEKEGAAAFVVDRTCIQCDGPGCHNWAPSKRCSRCLRSYYCSRECQKADWKKGHGKHCKEPPKKKFDEFLVSSGADRVNELWQSAFTSVAGDDDEALNTECPICFEALPENAVVLKACRHAFCPNCLIQWQKQQTVDQRIQQRQRLSVGEIVTPCPLCKNTETGDIEEDLLTKADLLLVGAKLPLNSEEQKESMRKRALNCIDKVLMAENAKMDAYVTKAKILLTLGRHSEAIEAADEAIEENEKRKSDPLVVLSFEAKAAKERGDTPEFKRIVCEIGEQMSNFHKAPLSLLNSYAECKLVKCVALENQNDFQGAFELYSEITDETKASDDESKTHDTIFECMVGLARCNYEMGKHKHAVVWSDGVIDLYRNRPNVHKYKALSLRELGRLDEAVKVMQCAVLYETPWNMDDEHNAEVWRLYKELCAERDGAQNS